KKKKSRTRQTPPSCDDVVVSRETHSDITVADLYVVINAEDVTPPTSAKAAELPRPSRGAAGSAPSVAAGLEQEPGALFGLVDPVLEKTCRRYVAVLVAQVVHLAHALGEVLVVLAQLGQHVLRRDELGVVVGQPRRG